MTGSSIYAQPAYILQHKPYRESSLILEVFTQDFGLLTLLAKGVRKAKSRTAGVLLPFSLLHISYLDRHELKLLLDVELLEQHVLARLSLYCGFYVNELLQRFLQLQDPNPELFVRYQQVLQQLARVQDAEVERCLRFFELDLLEQAGYGVVLDRDARSGKPVLSDQVYAYQPDFGMVADARGHVNGSTLLALTARTALGSVEQQQAKQLLRLMLAPYLQGKPLKSRAVLARVMHYL